MESLNELLANEVFGLATVRQVVIIVHLFGLAIGAGAAFFSDFLFTEALKDRTISKDEFRIIDLTSTVVWVGLAVLLTSGAILFFSDIDKYLDSSKFIAKMSIILILAVNGLVFHYKHFPIFQRSIGKKITSKSIAVPLRPVFISGAVSGVSWAAAIVLGSLSSVPLSYYAIMGIYAVVISVAAWVGVLLHTHYTAFSK